MKKFFVLFALAVAVLFVASPVVAAGGLTPEGINQALATCGSEVQVSMVEPFTDDVGNEWVALWSPNITAQNWEEAVACLENAYPDWDFSAWSGKLIAWESSVPLQWNYRGTVAGFWPAEWGPTPTATPAPTQAPVAGGDGFVAPTPSSDDSIFLEFLRELLGLIEAFLASH